MKSKWVESNYVKHLPQVVYNLTGLITLLVMGLSIYSLWKASSIYPTAELYRAYMPSDTVNLIIGLPLLLFCLFGVRRRSLAGLLCWPGALFFVIYSYSLYLWGIPFGVLFPLYLLIVSISIYTLILLLASMDGTAIKEKLQACVPVKTAGGILIALAVMLSIRVGVLIGNALVKDVFVSQTDLALWMVDFLIGCPPLLIIGILLWRRHPFGYTAGGGVLLQYGLLSLGLVPVLFIQAKLSAVSVDMAGILIVLIMAGLCLVPFAGFMRGSTRDF